MAGLWSPGAQGEHGDVVGGAIVDSLEQGVAQLLQRLLDGCGCGVAHPVQPVDVGWSESLGHDDLGSVLYTLLATTM